MPVTYEVNKDRRLVFITASGDVTGEEAFETVKKIYEDKDAAPYSQVADLIHVTGVTLDAAEIERLIKFVSHRQFPHTKRLALVVGSSLTVGLASQYEAFFKIHSDSGRQVKSFESMDEAAAWAAQR